MKKSAFELDMTKGAILPNILRFAIPYMLTSMLNIFYNAADLIVVSRWTGSLAMSSVGATSSLTSLITTLFLGMSIGSSVTISRSYGSHNEDAIHRAVHTAMLFCVMLGVVAFATGQILTKPLLLAMGTPKGEVLQGATLYMRIIFVGTPAMLVYNFGASVLRSVGDTKRPLYILSISGLINVLLNLVFVIKFSLGVAGVAIATIVSQYISATAVTITLMKTNESYKLIPSKLRIYKKEFLSIIKIGLPAGIQNTTLNFSNAIIQSSVNSFGAAAMAGNAATANIENFAFAFKDSFRQATITSISQNYGARNKKRMNKCFNVCLMCMFVGGLLLGLFMTVFARQLLGIYITDSPEAIRYGIIRMIVTALPYFLSGIMDIYTGYLRGLGRSMTATVNSLAGICGFRILWVLAIFPFIGKSYWALYLCWPISWALVALMNMVSLHFAKKKCLASFD